MRCSAVVACCVLWRCAAPRASDTRCARAATIHQGHAKFLADAAPLLPESEWQVALASATERLEAAALRGLEQGRAPLARAVRACVASGRRAGPAGAEPAEAQPPLQGVVEATGTLATELQRLRARHSELSAQLGERFARVAEKQAQDAESAVLEAAGSWAALGDVEEAAALAKESLRSGSAPVLPQRGCRFDPNKLRAAAGPGEAQPPDLARLDAQLGMVPADCA